MATDEWKSELQFQSKLFIWFYNSFPEFRITSKKIRTPRSLLVHNYLNPKNAVDGAKLAAAGLCKGFPDLSLHVARGGYHGLMIELKLPSKKPRPEQFDVMNALENQGFKVVWSDDFEEVKKIIIDYLALVN